MPRRTPHIVSPSAARSFRTVRHRLHLSGFRQWNVEMGRFQRFCWRSRSSWPRPLNDVPLSLADTGRCVHTLLESGEGVFLTQLRNRGMAEVEGASDRTGLCGWAVRASSKNWKQARREQQNEIAHKTVGSCVLQRRRRTSPFLFLGVCVDQLVQAWHREIQASSGQQRKVVRCFFFGYSLPTEDHATASQTAVVGEVVPHT